MSTGKGPTLAQAVASLEAALPRREDWSDIVARHVRGRVEELLNRHLPVEPGHEDGETTKETADPEPTGEGASASPDLAGRILAFLQVNPGASARKLRRGVEGRARAIDRAVDRLVEEGKVADDGHGGRHEYRVRVRDARVPPRTRLHPYPE